MCDTLRRLVGTTAPGHIMIVQFRNEKVSNHGSLPINIDCNVVAFIIFEEDAESSTRCVCGLLKELRHVMRLWRSTVPFLKRYNFQVSPVTGDV
ncbi:hypothetical protein TNCV_433661 [Trichonephila clavipes]|nr:hypothetical protein TNCV_433661 [Trichonephila clavipes]